MERYLKRDIQPFVQCCEDMSRWFYNRFERLLYHHISIPSLAITITFRDIIKVQEKPPVEVYTPSEATYRAIQEKVPGGASILFSLEAVAGETKIKKQEFGDDALLCKSIFSLDASKFFMHTDIEVTTHMNPL